LAVEAMMAPAGDERCLPAMYMVRPFNRLPTVPERADPVGYLIRAYREAEVGIVRGLVDVDGPLTERAWEDFRDRIIPGGTFLGIHVASGTPVATASAIHNPRATRYYFPFGGEVGYVAVDSAHRRHGLGRALVGRTVNRMIDAGYRHIFVGVQRWRLSALKCYLSLGFVPLVHNEGLLPR
jgi:mycothiol synthase